MSENEVYLDKDKDQKGVFVSAYLYKCLNKKAKFMVFQTLLIYSPNLRNIGALNIYIVMLVLILYCYILFRIDFLPSRGIHRG